MANTSIQFRIKQSQSDPTRGKLVLTCDKTTGGECEFPLWSGPAGGVMWHWDGNVEQPTISPSIDCKGGCGRHFSIISGRVV